MFGPHGSNKAPATASQARAAPPPAAITRAKRGRSSPSTSPRRLRHDGRIPVKAVHCRIGGLGRLLLSSLRFGYCWAQQSFRIQVAAAAVALHTAAARRALSLIVSTWRPGGCRKLCVFEGARTARGQQCRLRSDCWCADAGGGTCWNADHGAVPPWQQRSQ